MIGRSKLYFHSRQSEILLNAGVSFEALIITVFPRTARLDEGRFYPKSLHPSANSLCRELRAIVRSNIFRYPVNQKQITQGMQCAKAHTQYEFFQNLLDGDHQECNSVNTHVHNANIDKLIYSLSSNKWKFTKLKFWTSSSRY